MNHCKKILISEILTQDDVVFTENIIFSNKIGKHFTIDSYKCMEKFLDTLSYTIFNISDKMYEDFLQTIDIPTCEQCIKAVCAIAHKYPAEACEMIIAMLTSRMKF